MANWADTAPDESTAYVTVLTNLRDRDKDVAKMFSSDPTNPAENFMRYNRAGNKFQEYLSAVWTDKLLSIAGGGTGAATAADARTNLGLGSMATQANNAVNITGGTITSGAAIDAAALTSGLVAQARLGSGSGGLGQKFLADNQTWIAAEGVLVGTGFLWFTNVAPAGYLMCDGSAVNRTTYSALFAIIGTTYGAGDGSTTFNLPDLRQRFPLGKAASGTGSTLAGTGGAIDHTHTGSAHTHSISSDGAHTHTGPSHTHGVTGSTASVNLNHGHTFSGTTGNNDSAVNTDAPGGPAPYTQTHTHSFSGTTAGMDSNVDHAHGVGSLATSAAGTGATSSDGSHSHTGATGSGGGGATSSNNPPYLVVNFIIKH